MSDPDIHLPQGPPPEPPQEPPQAPPPEPPKFCGECGQAMPRAAAVCPRCGRAQAPAGMPAPAALPVAPPAPPAGATNGMAVASLVLGIMWLYWIGSILAIIFGHLALAQIRRSQGNAQGRGMAIAGLVLGYVGIGFLVLVILLALSLPWLGHMHGRGVMV